MPNGLAVFVKFINQRHASGNIDGGDRFFAEVVEVHRHGPQRIAVGGDQNGLARVHSRLDFRLIVGDHPGDGILQTLCQRQFLRIDLRIQGLFCGIPFVVRRKRRRLHVEGAPPDMHLFFAIFFRGFRLIQALQCAVVTLVQFPAPHHRDIGFAHLGQCQCQRMIGPLQVGGIGNVKVIAFRLHEPSGGLRLFGSLFGQVNIRPPGKTVFQIPFAFSMPQQNERVFHSLWPPI